jgi:hypothetical protein
MRHPWTRKALQIVPLQRYVELCMAISASLDVAAVPPCMASGADPELWHSESASAERLAKQLCSRCPVQYECAAYAVRSEEWGVWGGTTAKERREMAPP